MIIWIDGDSCPKEIKEIVYKTAIRKNLKLNYIANSYHRIPQNQLFSLVIVDRSPDSADQHIIDNLDTGDIVITSDIPLAYEAVLKKASVISPRGEGFTESNIREKLATRDLMQELRSSGTVTGGPRPTQAKDSMAFSNALDRLLHQKK